ncbi:MAG: NADH-quinone oxidoreductase subunit N [Planctomycetes bacterium]|nr:NADH-quinone oxidoreductase subunit N [Planctomycetota bacterium]
MLEQVLKSIQGFHPEAILAGGILLVILLDAIFRHRQKRFAGMLTLVILAFVMAAEVFSWGKYTAGGRSFSDLIRQDTFGFYFKMLFAGAGFLVVLFTELQQGFDLRKMEGEYYALLLISLLGMYLLVSAVNLLMLYVALEMISISSYILTGMIKDNRRSSEAAMKYILFGAVSSAIMLYGISMLYGFTGSLDYGMISIKSAGIHSAGLLVISALILAGFAYKIAGVPFHSWCPDVYEGAPTPITAFFSVAPKAAGFGALMRFLYETVVGKVLLKDAASDFNNIRMLPDTTLVWVLLLSLVSVLTMTYGNFAALKQTNIKRLLAYSSIAHAGYMLMGVVLMTKEGMQAVMFYLGIYLFMNLGAFLCVILISQKAGSENLEDWKGIGWKYPLVCVSMAIFLFSLTGLPPLAGFIGKLYIFAALVEANWLWLAVIGVLNSVVSLYYYAKVAKIMFLEGVPAGDAVAETQGLPASSAIVIFILLMPVVVLGIWWGGLKQLVATAFSVFTV